MKRKLVFISMTLCCLVVFSSNAFAWQRLGARGKIQRMIVNHNMEADEIYITTDDPNPACIELRLRSDNPWLTELSFKNLYIYLLTAKMNNKKVEFFVGENDCLIFRAEMVDD